MLYTFKCLIANSPRGKNLLQRETEILTPILVRFGGFS